MTHTSTQTRKPFARIVDHPTLGQILASVDTDSDGEAALKFVADTHPDHVAPTSISLGFKESEDLHAKLAAMSEAEILAAGEAIHNQLVQMMGFPNLLEAA